MLDVLKGPLVWMPATVHHRWDDASPRPRRVEALFGEHGDERTPFVALDLGVPGITVQDRKKPQADGRQVLAQPIERIETMTISDVGHDDAVRNQYPRRKRAEIRLCLCTVPWRVGDDERDGSGRQIGKHVGERTEAYVDGVRRIRGGECNRPGVAHAPLSSSVVRSSRGHALYWLVVSPQATVLLP